MIEKRLMKCKCGHEQIVPVRTHTIRKVGFPSKTQRIANYNCEKCKRWELFFDDEINKYKRIIE